MEDDFAPIDTEFDKICAGSADLTHLNQDKRQLKEGQIEVTGTFEAFKGKVQNGNSTTIVAEARPPAELVKGTTKDKTKTFPGSLQFFFRVDTVKPEVSGICEVRKDGKPGWRIMGKVAYQPEAHKYLLANRNAAWADTSNADFQSVRDFISADGTVISTRWCYVSPGDQVTMKMADKPKSIFRQDNPDQPGVPLVQPSTPLILPNIKAGVWVMLGETTVVQPLPPNSPADTKPVTVTVPRITSYTSYDCKAEGTVSPDYDKNMCLSERLHDTKNPSKHHMVPIEKFATKTRMPSRSAYFYFRTFMTRWIPNGDPNLEGITMRVEDSAPGDFCAEYNDERSPNVTLRFNCAQWRGRPNTLERYVVKLTVARNDRERISSAFGITDLDAYASILAANPEIPMHVEAKLWEAPTLNHSSNAPDVIRAKPEVATVRGYYVYGIEELVPDYLRYFLGPRGLRLSRERVFKEFAIWHFPPNAAGSETMNLTPSKPNQARVQRNPVNVFGDRGVITALGNGQLSNPDIVKSPPLYLAYSGDAIALFAGRHDFYVLTSHRMTDEEVRTWAGPAGTGPDSPKYADGFLDNLKHSYASAKQPFYYWIFAVKRDAKQAKPKPAPQPFVAPATTATDTTAVDNALKRERDESDPCKVESAVSPKRAAVEEPETTSFEEEEAALRAAEMDEDEN